jgi:esterase/lipase superfamily enzyme
VINLTPIDNISTIVGEYYDNDIFVSNYSGYLNGVPVPASPATIDLSSTTLIGINAILGNDRGDSIRGN